MWQILAAIGVLSLTGPVAALPMDLAEQKTTAALTCMALAGQAGRLDEMDRLFSYARQQLHSVWPEEQAQLRGMNFGPHYLTDASEDYMLGSMVGSTMSEVNQTLDDTLKAMANGSTYSADDKRLKAGLEFDKGNCSVIGR